MDTLQFKQRLQIGDPVQVSAECGWPSAPVGVVSSGPDLISTVLGDDYYYWVRFNPPVRDDGDGPYRSAQILSRYLRLIPGERVDTPDPNWEAQGIAQSKRLGRL